MKLRVIQPFLDYVVGAEIAIEAEIKKILASAHASHVVKVADTPPASTATAAPAATAATPANPA